MGPSTALVDHDHRHLMTDHPVSSDNTDSANGVATLEGDNAFPVHPSA